MSLGLPEEFLAGDLLICKKYCNVLKCEDCYLKNQIIKALSDPIIAATFLSGYVLSPHEAVQSLINALSMASGVLQRPHML